jgi:hypothetical protein
LCSPVAEAFAILTVHKNPRVANVKKTTECNGINLKLIEGFGLS